MQYTPCVTRYDLVLFIVFILLGSSMQVGQSSQKICSCYWEYNNCVIIFFPLTMKIDRVYYKYNEKLTKYCIYFKT